MSLYPPGWQPRRDTAPGRVGGRNPVSHARLLLLWVTNGVGAGGYPVGVHPSKGSAGTVAQWDAFTSGCDARALLVMALGGVPDPATGHRVRNATAEQLDLFEVAA